MGNDRWSAAVGSRAHHPRAFGAAARALRPGGRLLIQTPNVFDEHGRPCAPRDVEQELYVEARR